MSGNSGNKTKQLTLRLSEESHRKLKILAACSGRSMTEIMTCCIDERLKQCLEREMKKI
jgi:predicted HicB family RNase H-like nuclease